jgi:uncharacterized protein YkwD
MWVATMRISLRLASIVMLILLTVAWTAPSSAAPDPGVDEITSLAKKAVDLVNQERVKAGLNPLKWNDQLAVAATAYAQEMASRGFFAHNSPDGSTPVERARRSGYQAYGWGDVYVGENLGRGYNSAESVHQAWMNSEGHRTNLLLPKYRELGIGIAVAADGTRYWAQEFGSRPKVLPVFINDGAASTDSTRVNLTITDEEVSPWGSLASLSSMMVSNSPDFSGARWEPFAKTKSWNLQGRPGKQAVYVRLKDANDQIADSGVEIEFIGRQALGTLDLPLSATILSVWPRDGLPVAQASTANVTARLAVRDSGAPVPPDFPPPVVLMESLNGGPERVAAFGQERPENASLWDFNDVDVSLARDPANCYRFRVAVDSGDAQSTVWEHHQ